jgi:hypothetical protein
MPLQHSDQHRWPDYTYLVATRIGLARAAHADLGLLAGLTAGFGFLSVVLVLANRQRSRTQPNEQLKGWLAWWLRVVPLLASVIFGVCLLIWIGLAAGIK